jgi:hypothetical protein
VVSKLLAASFCCKGADKGSSVNFIMRIVFAFSVAESVAVSVLHPVFDRETQVRYLCEGRLATRTHNEAIRD